MVHKQSILSIYKFDFPTTNSARMQYATYFEAKFVIMYKYCYFN